MNFSIRKASAILCAAAVLAGNLSVTAASAFRLHQPVHPRVMRRIPAPSYTPDLLIVMPNQKLQNDELKETVDEVHGTVIGHIGEGALKCYIIKTEKGKLEETERKLKKDPKHFTCVGRNYRIDRCSVPDTASNPDFTSQWHLQAMHVPNVWDYCTGRGSTIAVLDSGCNASISSLNGNTSKGYDASKVVANIIGGAGNILPGIATPGITELTGLVGQAGNDIENGRADSDEDGHGTEMATSAAGRSNAGNGIGVAPNARIYPIKVTEFYDPLPGAGSHLVTTDLELIAAMIHLMTTNIRICSISYNAPYVGFHNAALHAPLHAYFQKYFLERSGMIFLCAGNDGCFDPTPPAFSTIGCLPYLWVVSGVDPHGNLYNKSNTGPYITFTAPGVDVATSGNDGPEIVANGTSFGPPILAGICALILDRQPSLPNLMVYQQLVAACATDPANADNYRDPSTKKNYTADPAQHGTKGVPISNTNFGWGMPDAWAAVMCSEYKPRNSISGGTGKSNYWSNLADASRRTRLGASAVKKGP